METTGLPSKYRANRKKFFLTYPKCPLPMETVLQFFQNIGNIDKYLIARELHSDGEPHLHCYIVFIDKQDFKNSRWADIEGYHPNDGGNIRNELAVSKYCSKDNNFITNFFKLDVYTLIFAEDVTVEQGLKMVREKRPRDYALYHNQIEGSLKRSKSLPFVAKFKSEDFKVPPQDFNGSLLIWGPSGYGKSRYAESHFKNPLVVNHPDKLKKFDSTKHDGIIFDDMRFHHWPAEAVIHLLDTESESDINVKHGYVTLPKDRKQIFTHNDENPFYSQEILDSQRDAIERRVKKFPVTFPLQKVSQ